MIYNEDLVSKDAKDRLVCFQIIDINSFVTAACYKLTAIIWELNCPQPKDIVAPKICGEVQTLMNILHPNPPSQTKLSCMHFQKQKWDFECGII